MSSESHILLIETAERLFADIGSRADADFETVWRILEEAAFSSLLVPEDKGGFGGDWLDATAVFRLAGFYAVPAPISEAILARHLLAEADHDVSQDLVTLAQSAEGTLDCGRFSGEVRAVAWGRNAETILTTLDGHLLVLPRAAAHTLIDAENPAGEPRDTLHFESAPVIATRADVDVAGLGAFARTAMIGGALDAALARSIAYANERVQFGKPIGKFQAVQQNLAMLAEEAAAVNCAAQAAAYALERADATMEIACAKLRANMAAAFGGPIAHQAHGAIGFTMEHGLHRWTRRLIAWSAEFGNERYWAERLGGQVAAFGAGALWHELTRRSDVA